MISDSPRATASDSLTGTDIMAAMGMTQERAAMGYSAFLGKMGISYNDRVRAIELLAQYALTKCDRVAALRKLDAEIKPLVMHQLATFAFEDYSRSAASVKQCDDCNGNGFIDAEVFSMKSHTPAREKKFVKMSLHLGVEDIPPSDYELHRQITDAISLDTWKKSVKPFYDQLITKFDIEEAWADAQLKQITK
ncbi:hypothetical protein ID866_182 [Astraeus odoratus]|nr:hypothetical protein ID866_182 [Astraeus odoratus]